MSERKHRKPLPHGTINGYIGWGCRCDECRQARRDYYGHRPLADYLTEVKGPDHGTAGRYRRGCRCDECRTAANAARQRRRRANIEATRAYDREYKRRKRAAA